MLQKVNKKDKDGNDLYQEVKLLDKGSNHAKVFGKVGTLAELSPNVLASERYATRNMPKDVSKVRSNRKHTKGRLMHFQTGIIKRSGTQKVPAYRKIVNGRYKNFDEELIEKYRPTSIKHVQETQDALNRKTTFLSTMDIIELNKSKWHKAHPEYQKKV